MAKRAIRRWTTRTTCRKRESSSAWRAASCINPRMADVVADGLVAKIRFASCGIRKRIAGHAVRFSLGRETRMPLACAHDFQSAQCRQYVKVDYSTLRRYSGCIRIST
jgi:hypothetical protein